MSQIEYYYIDQFLLCFQTTKKRRGKESGLILGDQINMISTKDFVKNNRFYR